MWKRIANVSARLRFLVLSRFTCMNLFSMKTTPAEVVGMRRGYLAQKVRPSVVQMLQNVWQTIFSSKVVPAGSAIVIGPMLPDLPSSRNLVRNMSAIHRRSIVAMTLRYLSFKDAFGVLGPPMVFVALVCISWTVWLIVLTLEPNETANYLMNTSDYDDGQFWLIPEELTTLQIFSVIGLLVVVLLYVFVLLKMLIWRVHNHAEGTLLDRILQQCAPENVGSPAELEFSHRVRRLIWELFIFLKELTGFRGKHRKLWNLCLKGFDLMMQTFMLVGLLEAGTPTSLTLGFAIFLALNSASCAVEIVGRRHSAFAEIIIDSLFDLSTTVLFPILVLVYCAKQFNFDRAVFMIYMELMPVGSFERRARMFASPTEIELFRVSFDSLRIRTVSDLFLRIGMNLGFSYRFKRVVEVLIQMQTQRLQERRRTKKSVKQQSRLLSFPKSVSRFQKCQRTVPRPLALLFVAYSTGILLVTLKAISASQKVCSAYPECVVFAYRWRYTNSCPCRALIDGNSAPKNYYEWTHPTSAAETVKALAAEGTLEVLQLINRQLTVLPTELRGCRRLNFIALINCAIEDLPPWINEFDKLQYLQIEGKVGSANLGELDPNVFSNMPRLRYLQFGLHQRMVHLPALDGAPNLGGLVLARMYNLTELPSLTHLSRLERMELTVLTYLSTIPDLQNVGPLVHFAIYQGAYLCCNGFLGTCDLSNPFCKSTKCLEDPTLKATQATLQVFHKFSDAVCQPYSAVSQTPTPKTIQMCNNAPFRQCILPGLDPNTTVVGMCYNHRMQVLACNPDPAKIRVRRRQIELGVGAPCNSTEEAWLGCNETSK